MGKHVNGTNGQPGGKRAAGWNIKALPDPTPAAPVAPAHSLDELLTHTQEYLRDYIAFPHLEQAVIVTIWIAHTWVVQAFTFTPYLSINSPVKRCGKSTLLDCLKLLVCKPWSAVMPSPAVLFRKIELDCPTLLLDEVDTIFSNAKGDEGKEELRAVLNAGFQRGAKVPRCVGPTHTLAEFSVFCAKALAGIGKLPDTVADRSIPIVLARKARTQQLAKFRFRDVSERAEMLRNALAGWAQDPVVISALTEARPAIPDRLGDRAADISEPLLALADLAGGDWPESVRAALVKLCNGDAGEDDNLPIKLLSACREIFAEEDVDRLSSRDLLDKLVAREDDAPWAMWWEADLSKGNAKGPAARLARLLKPFDVYSRKYREGTETVRGYLREVFEDAFVRYLPENEKKDGTTE